MLTYEEFKEVIREKAEAETGCGAVVSKVFKNNGITYDGLIIMALDCNVSPTIYLNEYYDLYVENVDAKSRAIEFVWEKIYSIYKENLPKFDFDVSQFADFEKMKEKVRVRLVNTELNKERLSDIANVPFLDLSIIFYVWIDSGACKNGSITIHKEHLKLWGKTEEELLEIALENSRNEYALATLTDLVKEMSGEEIKGLCEDDLKSLIPMYVISNSTRVFGASAILYPNALKHFAETFHCTRVIIISSSVHEGILVPCEESEDIECYNRMVEQVNESMLQPEEILSNHVYVYNRNSGKIEIA